MTPIRLVVSDVDGTLVDKEKQLTPATADAVARLEAQGVPFTIISARPRSGMMPIADTLGIDRPMGAFNGGTVFTRSGGVIARHTIDPAVAHGMVALARETAVDIWVFADDVWYATDGEGAHTRSERVSSNQEPTVVDDVAGLLDEADRAGWKLIQSLVECRDASSERCEGVSAAKLLESPWFAVPP